MKRTGPLVACIFLSASVVLADSAKEKGKIDAAPAAPRKSAKAARKVGPAKAEKVPAADPAAIAAAIEKLRQTLQAQHDEIQQLREELARRAAEIAGAKEAAAKAGTSAEAANAKASEATAASSEAKTTAATLNKAVAGVKATTEKLGTTVTVQEKKADDSPLAIRYKGITLTPGGFFAAESVWRQRAASADTNTPFTGIPFNGNSLSRLSEFNASGRHSRISMLAEGKIEHAKFTGYYEADFFGAGTTSNNRQSNSYVYRQRQIWGQAALDSGWAFTGGQMWSLATETKTGMQNRTEQPPMTIDPQYSVGFTWARQYGFRMVKDFNKKFALGFSIEGAQTTIGGRGFSSFQGTSATGVITTAQNFFTNAPGASGGLFNAFDPTGYSVNKTPDFILKAAADPGFGHYELFGIISTFRNRIYPCAAVGTTAGNPTPGTAAVACPVAGAPQFTPSAAGAFTDARTGGGMGASFRVPLLKKKADFGVKAVGGDGIGRYGSAQLADVTARPDGTLALIRTAHGLGTLEVHPTPKIDIYFNFGEEYAWRAAYTGYTQIRQTSTPAVPGILATTTTTISTTGIGGYGSPFANDNGCDTENPPAGTSAPSTGGTCAGDIKNIFEGTIGFWHRFYSGPKGRIQWGLQYSYLQKNAWSGNNNVPTNPGVKPKAIDNMFWASFRYYIP